MNQIRPATKVLVFRVSCKEVFTTQAQRAEAATESGKISRKDAKAQRSERN